MIDKTIGCNGDDWIAAAEISLPISDLGFRQGVTAVERLRTYHGRVWQLARHLERFKMTCDGIGIAFDQDWWREKVAVLIKKNDATIRSNDVGIVLLATPGSEPNRAKPTRLLNLSKIDHRRVDQRRVGGQGIVVTEVMQPPAKSWPRQWKVRNRLHYYLADQFAQQLDPDATGMLVDDDLSVTESSIASLAIVTRGTIQFPPADRVLSSITASVVQDIAEQNRWSVEERSITPEDIIAADEIWLMGTDTGVWFGNRVWHAGQWHSKTNAPPPKFTNVLSNFLDATLSVDVE